MSASVNYRQETLSYTSLSTGTYTQSSANSENQNSQQKQTTETKEQSVSVFSDSFEFSGRAVNSNFIYTSSISQNRIIQQEETNSNQLLPLPGNTEDLKKDADQYLTDYFGKDTPKQKKYMTTLKNIETIDFDLANKARFVLTLLNKEDADKFLNNLTELSRNFRNTQTTETSPNVVATTESTTLNKVYAEMRSNTEMALEEYGEIISAKFNVELNIQNLSFGNNNSSFCDPLVLDLAGDGIDLTTTEDGVEFDIDGDGTTEQTAFIKGDDALLYLDDNGNGVVDSGRELFGDQEGDANGYAELSRYDENNDGKIDELDAVYSKLRLWQDKNQDGTNQESESLTLLEAGIKSIQLKYDTINQKDNSGNIIGQTGEFTRMDGSTGYSADMLLRTHSLPSNRVSKLLSA